MGSLLVVSGPPGSGKSTAAQVLVERAVSSVLVEGDRFFAFLPRDAPEPWLPEAHDQNSVVVSAAAAATGRFVAGGYTTVYDGVIGPWFIREFASSAGVAELDYVVLMPALDTCLDRVKTRKEHGFRDSDATRKMYEEFSTAEVETRHVLALGSDTADEVATRIAGARGAGDLRLA